MNATYALRTAYCIAHAPIGLHRSTHEPPATRALRSPISAVTRLSCPSLRARDQTLRNTSLSSRVQHSDAGSSVQFRAALYSRTQDAAISQVRLPPSIDGSISRENYLCWTSEMVSAARRERAFVPQIYYIAMRKTRWSHLCRVRVHPDILPLAVVRQAHVKCNLRIGGRCLPATNVLVERRNEQVRCTGCQHTFEKSRDRKAAQMSRCRKWQSALRRHVATTRGHFKYFGSAIDERRILHGRGIARIIPLRV